MKIQMLPHWIIFSGFILSAIGVFWAGSQQNESEIALRLKSEEITELNKEIATIT